MNPVRTALYARVSSDQQSKAHTIDSQIAAILERAEAGDCRIPASYRFVDDGYSGSILSRPALERLRDLVASGGVDRIFVLAPDRLARSFIHQIILTEEFDRAGVELVFLNRPLAKTPEDTMLLQIQGAMAEYEKAKHLERIRRGRRHAAKCGSVSAMSAAPYGYRYITKVQGGGEARVEVIPEQAEAVRQIFEWVVCERMTIRRVIDRLEERGILSPHGHPRWSTTTLFWLLKNPAYIGEAAFGKWRAVPWRKPIRPQRGNAEFPRKPCTDIMVPEEEWVRIPFPALVERSWFEAVGEQLRQNQERMRIRREGARGLLQGLLVCKRCGYGFIRKTRHGEGANAQVEKPVYLCSWMHRPKRDRGREVDHCGNRQIPAEDLEGVVWDSVKGLMNEPERVEAEYLRRLEHIESKARIDVVAVKKEEARLHSNLSRLIDGFTEGLIQKAEFEPRSRSLRQRLVQLEAEMREAQGMGNTRQEIRYLVGQLATFASKVREGLEVADWQTRRNLIVTLVKRVEIDLDEVTIVFRVGEAQPIDRTNGGLGQHCSGLSGGE